MQIIVYKQRMWYVDLNETIVDMLTENINSDISSCDKNIEMYKIQFVQIMFLDWDEWFWFITYNPNIMAIWPRWDKIYPIFHPNIKCLYSRYNLSMT